MDPTLLLDDLVFSIMGMLLSSAFQKTKLLSSFEKKPLLIASHVCEYLAKYNTKLFNGLLKLVTVYAHVYVSVFT